MLVVLGVHVQIIMIVAVDYTATIRGLAMCVHHVLILCGRNYTTVNGTYDSTLDFAYASSGNSCCNQLDCGVHEKCVSASAMGITACACDTDRGKVAGVAVLLLDVLICIHIRNLSTPQATVAQA